MKTLLLTTTSAFTLVSCQTTTPAPVVLPPTSTIKATPKPAPTITQKTSSKIKPYPLEKCLVTDEPLDEWDDMQTTVYQGQEMRFCCKMCLKKFNKSPDKYLAQLHETHE